MLSINNFLFFKYQIKLEVPDQTMTAQFKDHIMSPMSHKDPELFLSQLP